MCGPYLPVGHDATKAHFVRVVIQRTAWPVEDGKPQEFVLQRPWAREESVRFVFERSLAPYCLMVLRIRPPWGQRQRRARSEILAELTWSGSCLTLAPRPTGPFGTVGGVGRAP
jgi:hypothetical protein